MRRLKPTGFTLVELLTVVSLLVVLLSIFTPSFMTAIQLARKSRCQANLRAIGVGAAVYQSSYKGYNAIGTERRTTTDDDFYDRGPNCIPWSNALMPYLPAGSSAGTQKTSNYGPGAEYFRCAGVDHRLDANAAREQWGYGVLRRPWDPRLNDANNIITRWYLNPRAFYAPSSGPQIQPSMVIYVADTARCTAPDIEWMGSGSFDIYDRTANHPISSADPNDPTWGRYMILTTSLFDQTDMQTVGDTGLRLIADRHLGQANILFFDNHVSSMRGTDLINLPRVQPSQLVRTDITP